MWSCAYSPITALYGTVRDLHKWIIMTPFINSVQLIRSRHLQGFQNFQSFQGFQSSLFLLSTGFRPHNRRGRPTHSRRFEADCVGPPRRRITERLSGICRCGIAGDRRVERLAQSTHSNDFADLHGRTAREIRQARAKQVGRMWSKQSVGGSHGCGAARVSTNAERGTWEELSLTINICESIWALSSGSQW